MSVAAPPGRLSGKIALVTGAASGIGQATAIVFARHGSAVVCADLNADGAGATAATITSSGGSATGLPLDVTSEAAWQGAIGQLLNLYGRLDVAVNCAGISAAGPVAELGLADWRRVLSVNLDGVFLGTRHAIRAMRTNPRGGSIVNVASASGVRPAAGASAYCASKAAVIMLSKTAALECQQAGYAIRVNAVSPGGVKTQIWRSMPFFQELVAKTGSEEAAFRAMAGPAPSARFAEAEEIALAILYLASDESSFVTGANLVIDNGYTA